MKRLVNSPLFFALFFTPSLFAQTQTLTYTYDALGRATYVNDSINGNRDYDYDAAGNRLLVSVGTTNDPAAEPAPPPAAPTGLNCYPIAQGAWKGTWNLVPGADHYVFRLGDNYLSAYTPNEPNYAVRITGTSSPISTPVYSINTTTQPCKWVQACDASNKCGPQAYF